MQSMEMGNGLLCLFCFYFLYDSQLVCVDEIFFRCGIQWLGAQKVSPLVKKVVSIACSMVGQL